MMDRCVLYFGMITSDHPPYLRKGQYREDSRLFGNAIPLACQDGDALPRGRVRVRLPRLHEVSSYMVHIISVGSCQVV